MKLCASVIALSLVIAPCSADTVKPLQPPVNLWQGLIAEAVSEGPDGLYDIAVVYRHRLERGLPLGCAGLHRPNLEGFIAEQGPKWPGIAQNAVALAFSPNYRDTVGGADHYENVEAFGVPDWSIPMVQTCKHGKHTFFDSGKR